MNYPQGFGLNLGSYANNYGSNPSPIFGSNYFKNLSLTNPNPSLGLAGNSGVNLATEQGSKLSRMAGKFGDFAGKYGGLALQGISTGVAVYNAFEQAKANKEMISAANKQLTLAREQFDEETKRYNAREKERLDANQHVAQSASLYDNPMMRK